MPSAPCAGGGHFVTRIPVVALWDRAGLALLGMGIRLSFAEDALGPVGCEERVGHGHDQEAEG
jgi:hypothetical protein